MCYIGQPAGGMSRSGRARRLCRQGGTMDIPEVHVETFAQKRRMAQSHQELESLNPTKMVWFIIVLGCFVGVFMSFIVWRTSIDMRTERERLVQLSSQIGEIRSTIEQMMVQNKWAMYGILTPENAEAGVAEWQEFSSLLTDYRAAASFARLGKDFDMLMQREEPRRQLFDQCRHWAEKAAANRAALPAARQEVDGSLAALAGAVGNADDAFLQKELSELTILVERLAGADSIDSLAELKDGPLWRVLVGFRKQIGRMVVESADRAQLLRALLDDFETAMLGRGFFIGTSYPQIAPGKDGLFAHCRKRLMLQDERERLRVDIESWFDGMRSSLHAIGVKVEMAMQLEAARAEKTLRQAWRTMLFVTFLMAVVFLLVSASILKAIKEQIRVITDSNQALDEKTRELLESQKILQEKQEQLERLSSSLLTAQEDERQRIARELHDELGQSLTALKLQVRSAEKSMGETASLALSEKCALLRHTINLIIENVRRLSRDLSPAALDDLGIEVALAQMLDSFAELTSIRVEKDIAPLGLLANQELQRNVYRIIQELLNNIAKHARAQKVVLAVSKADRELRISLADDGAGFDVESRLRRQGVRQGMGLSTIAERVRIMGGRLEMKSAIGQGTEVFFTVPLSQAGRRDGPESEEKTETGGNDSPDCRQIAGQCESTMELESIG